MAESTQDGTGGSLTVNDAASMFERMDSPDEGETSTAEDSQQDVAKDPPEKVEEDETEQLDEVEELLDADDDGELEDVDPDAPKVAEPVTLKVNLPDGEQELPVDEVVKGYLRQTDYTRKTQALAEDRKTLSRELEDVRAERPRLASQLTQLEEALKSFEPTEPDWAWLKEERPDQFANEWASWQQHKDRMSSIASARQKAVDAATADQIERLQSHVESERQKLSEVIPAWKDETVKAKDLDDIKKFALSHGYTESELNQVYDSRTMVLLRKAYLYDKRETAKPVVRAKIEAVKVATPGPASASRKPQTERTKAKRALEQTGRVDDAAAWFDQAGD